MDRDKRWERVREAYNLLVEGKGKNATDMVQAMQESYDKGVTDEFIKPIVHVDENGNSAPVKLYYNSEQAAIAAYPAATSDNITYYPYGMDEDINEGVFDIITRIWKMILDFFKSLFGIA